MLALASLAGMTMYMPLIELAQNCDKVVPYMDSNHIRAQKVQIIYSEVL